jgi:branched-chain amino acid transport system ATP-binding protein
MSSVSIYGIGLTIDGNRILNDISFDLQPGEVVGLIGPNGAGKTSLINVVSGLFQPTAGKVGILGQDVTGWKPHRRAQAGLGRTFQTSSLFGGLSVAENVRLALMAEDPDLSTGFQTPRLNSAVEDRVQGILKRVRLSELSKRPAQSLSHGDKRKLELAMILGTGAKIMLLDEPMAGVNMEDIDPLIELIREIHDESKPTILFVEHHMEVVLSLSHRVAVLHHGSLLAIDEPKAVMSNETVQSAYIGAVL